MIVDGEIDRGSVFVVFFSCMGGAFVLGRAGPQMTLINAARGAATSMYDIIDRVCTLLSPAKNTVPMRRCPKSTVIRVTAGHHSSRRAGSGSRRCTSPIPHARISR